MGLLVNSLMPWRPKRSVICWTWSAWNQKRRVCFGRILLPPPVVLITDAKLDVQTCRDTQPLSKVSFVCHRLPNWALELCVNNQLVCWVSGTCPQTLQRHKSSWILVNRDCGVSLDYITSFKNNTAFLISCARVWHWLKIEPCTSNTQPAMSWHWQDTNWLSPVSDFEAFRLKMRNIWTAVQDWTRKSQMEFFFYSFLLHGFVLISAVDLCALLNSIKRVCTLK